VVLVRNAYGQLAIRKGEEVVLDDEVGPGRCRLSDENRIRIGFNHRSNNRRSRKCVPSHDQEEVPRLVDPFGASQATEHWIGKSAVAPGSIVASFSFSLACERAMSKATRHS